jgi:hypothetical protein
LSAFFAETKGFFTSPPERTELRSSLLTLFGESGAGAAEKMLRFCADHDDERANTNCMGA